MKRVSITILVFFFLLPIRSKACAEWYVNPFDYFISFYNADLTNIPGYKPFYHSTMQYLYDFDARESKSDINLDAWAKYLSVNKDVDLNSFIYQSNYSALSNLYYHIEKNAPYTVVDSFKSNKICKRFEEGKDLEALGYIMYAKQCEPYATSANDWEVPALDYEKMSKLIKNGKQLYNAAKNNFIKERYAFQIVRLAHYSGEHTRCVALYDSLCTPIASPSFINDWSLAHKAGALFRLQQGAKAAYLFAQVFNNCPTVRIESYTSFDWSVIHATDKPSSFFSYCKNDEEKANVISLFAFNTMDNSMRYLNALYDLSPQHKSIESLLVREVNRIEEDVVGPQLQSKRSKIFSANYFYDEAEVNKSEEMTDLYDFVEKVLKSSPKNINFWMLTKAYLLYLKGDNEKAIQTIKQIEVKSLDEKLRRQYETTRLLILVSKQEKLDDQFEASILPTLEWLNQEAKKDVVVARSTRNIYVTILGLKYHQQNDLSKEALCYQKAQATSKSSKDFEEYDDSYGWFNSYDDFLKNYVNKETTIKLMTMLESKQTSYTNFLLSEMQGAESKDYLNDLTGTYYLREFDFKNALLYWSKISASSKVQNGLEASSFDAFYADRHDGMTDKGPKYDKIKFASKMIALEEQVNAKTGDLGKAYFDMANGYYNMSFYGNSWWMGKYDWSYGEISYGYIDSSNLHKPFYMNYYYCNKAEEMFIKAKNASSDRNFKAICTFMAAKCEQKRVYDEDAYSYDWRAERTHIKTKGGPMHDSKYFAQLINEFSDTRLVKQMLNECSFLKDFSR